MSDFVLSCCSTVDITKEMIEERDLKCIFFHYELGDEQYPDDLGQTMDFHEFYQAMKAGAMTRTSQVNVEEYTEYFEGFLKEGKDVLHLCLSSGISGTYNAASIAREDLQEKYPDRKIYVVDSLAASAGYGLFMITLADMRDEGKGIDELHDWAEANKKFLHHWFFTSDLTFLIRGGRVSKAAGAIGQVLNICPLLNVDYEGRLINRMKVRTKKKVILEAVNKMKMHATDGLDYSGKCFISHSDVLEDAKEEAGIIEETFKKLNGKVNITYIGTTIGSHTGPGTVALFFWGDERVD